MSTKLLLIIWTDSCRRRLLKLVWVLLLLSIFRTVMTGLGFWGGDWEKNKEKCRKVNLIEPVVEGVTQLFFQSIILYIIHGPGTSKIHCKYKISNLNLAALLKKRQIGLIKLKLRQSIKDIKRPLLRSEPARWGD